MGLPYVENFMILTSRYWFCMVHPCDRRTNGQTDGRTGDSI